MWRALRVPAVLYGAAVLTFFAAAAFDRPRDFALAGIVWTAVAFAVSRSSWIDASDRRRWGHGLILAAAALAFGLAWAAAANLMNIDFAVTGLALGAALGLAGAMTLSASAQREPSPSDPDADDVDAQAWTKLSPAAAATARQMLAEARRMRRLSDRTFSQVVNLVGVTVLVVLFAGVITSIDAIGASARSKALALVREARTERDLMRREHLDLLVEINSQITETSLPHTSSANDDLAAAPELRGPAGLSPPASQLAFLSPTLPLMLENTLRDLAAAEVRLGEALDLLKRADEADILQASAQRQTTEALIASAVTRFGVIIVLMFLAQALLNVYRYALRLSAFHRSRAHILALTGGDPAQIAQIARVFAADQVSLGREPRSPIEEAQKIAQIAKDLRP